MTAPLERNRFLDRVASSVHILLENSVFLLAGAVTAFIWANVRPESYKPIAHAIHFAVNDIAMAFFFLVAAKEIREAMLPMGSLASARTAALPILATAGGMLGPAGLYAVGAWQLDPTLMRGWAIPMATDIAFSYLVARLIFRRVEGATHPAIVFLLLLAVADDAGGLIVLAAFYPQEPNQLMLLLGLPRSIAIFGGLGLTVFTGLLMWKRLHITSFWPYLLVPGLISWFAFYIGGIHPALALVPLAWLMPHEHADMGIWAVGESDKQDTLNRMEHWWKSPVELILGLFGFVNAGVELSAMGLGTWLVCGGLLVGKPVGIVLFAGIGQLLGLSLPRGMRTRDLIIVGMAAGIGFTVALFISVVAFPPGAQQDSVKMGALFSFGMAPLTLLAARLLRVGQPPRDPSGSAHPS